LLRRYRVNDYNIPRMYRVLYSWTLHNRAILYYLDAGKTPAIVLSYEKLMDMQSNEEVERLRQFVGRPLTDARDPNLYRHRTRREERLPAAARFLIPFLPADPRQVFTALEQSRLHLSIP
ncbi:MAG TPA: hypothetical protein VLS48_01680, partial [Anaerolineales bacterium]|nr:hypothetical protein [Anaerolineales bacterium]